MGMSAQVTRFLPIAGTWSFDDPWYQQGPWLDYMAAHGFLPVRDEDGAPFRWTTNLNGLGNLLRRIPLVNRLPSVRHDEWDWRAGGDALAYFMDSDVEIEDRNLVAHSHGGPVVAFACARRRIRTLITIGTPARADLQQVWTKARPNIGYWLHVMDADADEIGWLGGIGDGRVSTSRLQPLADRNLLLKDISHSNLLRNPAFFDLWEREGLLDVLRAAMPEAA